MAKIISVKEKASWKNKKKIILKQFFNDKSEKWCSSNRNIIIGLIILVSVLFRVVYFNQINDTHLINSHQWKESDMSFFDTWASIISEGNILSDTALHPMHQWTKAVAARYFKDHPAVYESLKKQSGSDTLKNTPSKMLWDKWYGGKRFHQEPLYV
jgi:hypothetical protein